METLPAKAGEGINLIFVVMKVIAFGYICGGFRGRKADF
jgi:hypothetical protein